MKKLLSGMLTLALVAPYCLPAQAAPADSQQSFQPNVTYEVSVTDDERAIIHDEVDKISGDVGNMEVGDGTYDPYSLIGGLAEGSSYDSISYSAYSNPTLYASHDNPLIALQYASYKATMESDPEAFADVSDLLDITYPVGTTGGTLASNYLNKMTAFGAVIPPTRESVWTPSSR